MEVREKLSANDGRDPFPSFLRRSQVPKEVLALSENDPRFLSADHYYRPHDLRIGEYIDILNRDMFYMIVMNLHVIGTNRIMVTEMKKWPKLDDRKLKLRRPLLLKFHHEV
jgi:hypothetical protein